MAALTHTDELQNLIGLGINTDSGNLDLDAVLEKLKDEEAKQKEKMIGTRELFMKHEQQLVDAMKEQRGSIAELKAYKEEKGEVLSDKLSKRDKRLDKEIKRITKELSLDLERLIDEKYELKRMNLKRRREKEMKRVRDEIASHKGNVEIQKRTIEQEIERVNRELNQMKENPFGAPS
tara:strand:- start:66 stop:599 length:534 start_codon:yes stop_codon:yes gene_type:complete